MSTYKIHGTWMDGLPVWIVIRPEDLTEFNSGCYDGSILKGLSLDKKEMEALADKLNKDEEKAIDESILDALSRK